MRNQIDAIYKAFVDVEVTQERVHRSRCCSNLARNGERLLELTRTQLEQGVPGPKVDVDRIKKRLADAVASKRDKAIATLRQSKESLGALLKLSPKERLSLEVESRLKRLRSAVLPPIDELVRTALDVRPDVAALRFGERRAKDDFARSQAASSGPTRQDSSLAKGVTGTSANRNEGNIARAMINLQQTRIQMATMEKQVTQEVERAHLDCELAKNEFSRTESGTLSEAARLRDAAERDYVFRPAHGEIQGTARVAALLLEWTDYEKVETRYIDILARYLRSTLDLNTAVGERIMP